MGHKQRGGRFVLSCGCCCRISATSGEFQVAQGLGENGWKTWRRRSGVERMQKRGNDKWIWQPSAKSYNPPVLRSPAWGLLNLHLLNSRRRLGKPHSAVWEFTQDKGMTSSCKRDLQPAWISHRIQGWVFSIHSSCADRIGL